MPLSVKMAAFALKSSLRHTAQTIYRYLCANHNLEHSNHYHTMKEYYYLNDRKEQEGPVAGEDLPRYGVGRSTLVWAEGMAQWTPAGNVPELAPLFQSQNGGTPPPPPAGGSAEGKPDNLLVWSILATVLCCLPLGIVAIVYSAKVDTLWTQGRYEESREAASKAKTFCLISLGLGIVSAILGFIFGFFSALM